MEIGNLLFGNSRGNFPVERGDFQQAFWDFLESCGFDSYGHIEDDELEKNLQTVMGDVVKNINNEDYTEHMHFFENDVFIIRPYWWGESQNIAELSNFEFKPTNYQLKWYKYPLRDSYANQELTLEQFKEMLEKCKQSIKRA